MAIVVCDVCDQLPAGEHATMMVGSRKFVVCAVCQWKPFRVPPPKKLLVLVSDAAASSVSVARMP